MRQDGRNNDQLRPVRMHPGYIDYPEGSILIEMGLTRVLCNVTIESGVPRWKQSGLIPGGWLTAEYSLLPRSTQERTRRETSGFGGRTQEIRRLIGRSLRVALDFELLGDYTITVDCDVLQADGGTRTAAITGGYAALEIALQRAKETGMIPVMPIIHQVAAVSVGIVHGVPILDLCYSEDSSADVDLNIVMTEGLDFIEVQGTAEKTPYSKAELNEMISLAECGIRELLDLQKQVISSIEFGVEG